MKTEKDSSYDWGIDINPQDWGVDVDWENINCDFDNPQDWGVDVDWENINCDFDIEAIPVSSEEVREKSFKRMKSKRGKSEDKQGRNRENT